MALEQTILMDTSDADNFFVLGPIPSDTINRTLHLSIVCNGTLADVAQMGLAPAMCVANTQTTVNLDTGTSVLKGWGTARYPFTTYQIYNYIAGTKSVQYDLPLPATAEARYMLMYGSFSAVAGSPTVTVTATITQP